LYDMTEIIGTYDTTGSPALSVEQDIALLHHRLSTVQREHTEDRNRLEGTRAIARTAIRRIDELEGRVTVMAELLPGTPPANDELWRLARDYVREADRGNGSNVAATALQVYVREHS
jgi:hypothetical protein